MDKSKIGFSHVTNAGRFITDQWVVPYNPALLKRYQCHLNVEICTTDSVIKYLFDYLFKGVDKIATKVIDNNGEEFVDEIKDFVDNYYFCAYESAWNLLEFPRDGRFPGVERLPVHDDGERFVSYSRKDSDQTFIERLKENKQKDPLQSYFDTNKLEYEYRDKIEELYDKKKYLYKKDGTRKPLAKGTLCLYIEIDIYVV